MTRLQHLLPAGNLGRTRLAATVIGCLSILGILAQNGNGDQPQSWKLAAFLSILLIMAAIVMTPLRGKTPWWEPVTLPILIAVGGAGLVDPLATVALSMAVSIVLSLYGPTWQWIIRALGCFLAVPAAVAISPMSLGLGVSWQSPSVLGPLPQLLLISVMVRGIYLALRQQERASAREAVLARTGSRMISVTEVAQVRRIGIDAVNQIIALHPGVAMAILRHGSQGLFVGNLAGLPEELRDRAVPDAVVTDPAAFAAFAPEYRHWRIETFSTDLHLLTGGLRPVPDSITDAFRTIAHQVMLGEIACRSHAELEFQAHHDHLTRLPTRSKFFREADRAIAAGPPGSVALLLIDLDDFKGLVSSWVLAGGGGG